MISIFFDLETSTTEPIGQILNYSFVAVDDDFQIIDECSDNIKISVFELPVPEAILANRINVLEHQKESKLNEMQAMKKIFDFFCNMIEKNHGEKVTLVGYNSLKFDVPYLRTSMIRNGLSPYFNGKIIYRDLLHLVRKISCTRKDFIRTCKNDNNVDCDKLSLTLETTCQNYNILLGKQLHSSRDDVILTINLAKKLLEVFNADIRKYKGYELSYFEHKEYQNGIKIFTPIFPEYDLTKDTIYENKFYALLDYSDKYSLWIDLDKYKAYKCGEFEDLNNIKKVISWYSFNASYLFKPYENIRISNEYYDLAKVGLSELKDINLDNYFEVSECDIEQDIYRLSFNSLDLLHKIIWEKDLSVTKEQKNKDLNIVLSRWKLSNNDWNSESNDNCLKLLEMYANYRYGNEKKLLINKFAKKDSLNQNDFHPSFNELLCRINTLKSQYSDNSDDIILLNALETFYNKSTIATFVK